MNTVYLIGNREVAVDCHVEPGTTVGIVQTVRPACPGNARTGNCTVLVLA
jgi:hypothetical protein